MLQTHSITIVERTSCLVFEHVNPSNVSRETNFASASFMLRMPSGCISHNSMHNIQNFELYITFHNVINFIHTIKNLTSDQRAT